MSLTSYRAAPPRVKKGPRSQAIKAKGRRQTKARRFRNEASRSWLSERQRGVVLGRPGNDLLSRVLRHSTIGAEEFNGRVRDGIGFGLLAQITGPAKDNSKGARGPTRNFSKLQGQRSFLIKAGALGTVRFRKANFHHDHGQ